MTNIFGPPGAVAAAAAAAPQLTCVWQMARSGMAHEVRGELSAVYLPHVAGPSRNVRTKSRITASQRALRRLLDVCVFALVDEEQTIVKKKKKKTPLFSVTPVYCATEARTKDLLSGRQLRAVDG